MRKKEYNALCALIRVNWNSKDGVIVKLKKTPLDTKYLSLCVGSVNNKDLVANSCLLWEDNDLLYEGHLTSDDLLYILNRKRICHAEVTCVRLMQQGKHGINCCLGGTCTCQTCKYKTDKYRVLNTLLSE